MIGANGRQVRTSIRPNRKAKFGAALTQREIDVIGRLCSMDEPTVEVAAKDLFIAPATVQLHLHRSYLKLGVRTRLGMYRQVVEVRKIKLKEW